MQHEHFLKEETNRKHQLFIPSLTFDHPIQLEASVEMTGISPARSHRTTCANQRRSWQVLACLNRSLTLLGCSVWWTHVFAKSSVNTSPVESSYCQKNESRNQLAIKIIHVFVFFPMSPLQMICKILEHANLFPTLGLRTVQTGKVTGEWHPSHQSCVVSVGLHSARPGRIASHIFLQFFLASSQI